MTTSERTYQTRFTSAMRRHNTTGRLTPVTSAWRDLWKGIRSIPAGLAYLADRWLAATRPCVVCRRPLGPHSASDDFCCEECQAIWHAQQVGETHIVVCDAGCCRVKVPAGARVRETA